MDRNDTKKIIAIISATFPNFKVENPSVLIDSWTLCLNEYSYHDVELALMTFIKTQNSAFAPSVSQLIEMMKKPEELAQMNCAEAWALVMKALQNSTYNSTESFNRLPLEVQRCVGSASELRNMAIDERFNESVERSLFYKRYEIELKRKSEACWLPYEARESLNNIKQGLLGVNQ